MVEDQELKKLGEKVRLHLYDAMTLIDELECIAVEAVEEVKRLTLELEKKK